MSLPLRYLTGALAALLATTGAPALAQEDERYTLHAFGGVAGGWTDDNDYAFGNVAGSGSQAYAAVSLMARPMEQLTLVTQFAIELDSGEPELDLDWAFAEWRFADAVRLRAGHAHLPFGIYREIERVGTLRPFYLLPQSLYGLTEMGAENYSGLGGTGRILLPAAWFLEWDLYGGLIDVAERHPLDLLEGEAVRSERTLSGGGRLVVSPPLEGMRLMVSGYAGRVVGEVGDEPDLEALNAPAETVLVGGVSAEYASSFWLARAEAFMHVDDQGELTQMVYAETAVTLLEKLQVGARFEYSKGAIDPEEGTPRYGLHRELAATVNYLFSPQFVVKLSYHNVFGNRLAFPGPNRLAEVAADGTLAMRTHAVLLGTHFSF